MSYSKFDLKGKVALVTGGNGGIGLGMAEALAQAGADVCIWGRNKEKNSAAEDKLASYGCKILALECDVSDRRQVEEDLLGNGFEFLGDYPRLLLEFEALREQVAHRKTSNGAGFRARPKWNSKQENGSFSSLF